MPIMEELRDFIVKGNVVDLAVAFVMGAAFNALIGALVADIVTPLIGVPGHVDFASVSYTVNGSTFLIGAFVNSLITFLSIAVAVFFFIIKPMKAIQGRLRRPQAPAAISTKVCPECLSTIPAKARRCAYCTSVVR